MPGLHQPVHHFVQGPLVGHVKLLRVVGPLFFRVAAHRGAGSAADLGDADPQHPPAHVFRFPGGDDHAGIGYCQPDAGRDLDEGFIVNAVVEHVRIDIIRPLDPGHADGVRSHAVHGFQVLRVHDQAGKLILVQLQAEQDA